MAAFNSFKYFSASNERFSLSFIVFHFVLNCSWHCWPVKWAWTSQKAWYISWYRSSFFLDFVYTLWHVIYLLRHFKIRLLKSNLETVNTRGGNDKQEQHCQLYEEQVFFIMYFLIVLIKFKFKFFLLLTTYQYVKYPPPAPCVVLWSDYF